MAVQVLYSDLNQQDCVDTPLLYELDAVFQALTNLFKTRRGERVFRPEVSLNLTAVLWRPVNIRTAAEIESTLTQAVSLYEPRVKVVPRLSSVTPKPDDHAYDIQIAFEVAGYEGTTYEYTAMLEVAQ